MSAALSLPAACGRCADCEVADLARAFVAAHAATLAYCTAHPGGWEAWSEAEREAFKPIADAYTDTQTAMFAACGVTR